MTRPLIRRYRRVNIKTPHVRTRGAHRGRRLCFWMSPDWDGRLDDGRKLLRVPGVAPR